jgi:hypothetical protein
VIEAAPTTLADVQSVLASPSAVTARELERAKLTPWTALKFFRDSLKEGEARTVRIDGAIGFILGIAPHPLLPRRSSLWFIATEAYWRTGAAGVRFGRSFIKTLEARYPGEYLSARSWSDHPDVERWFALLGFQLEAIHGMSRVFTRHPGGKRKADILSSI